MPGVSAADEGLLPEEPSGKAHRGDERIEFRQEVPLGADGHLERKEPHNGPVRLGAPRQGAHARPPGTPTC